MSLYRLIYSSYGQSNLGYHDLKDIMEKSEKNNQFDGVAGLLCYGDSVFLQILEGDRYILQ
ncbi:BLUF domain-containing protein [Dolichospermum compactum]|uniref:BLUF domain protein n=1 Tax=Dolichospermum compactum NIES-806 TaxID=1973481 RepID=A0A1Z4V4H3_9CYAN|nr:BLUF domain-containing protein [Dolichospermum compactum]BAZ86377.1 BLUF domain protein [Dolichospermum compactum NIES-806]